MAQEIKMSAAGLKAMQEELEYLKTVRRKELAEEIKEARSHGDLSENSEYDEAKNTTKAPWATPCWVRLWATRPKCCRPPATPWSTPC